jgi:hypothetical protein
MYISYAISSKQYDYIVGWGIIAIFVSLIMELIINEVGRICMPSKYKDRQRILSLFKRGPHA